MIPMEDGNHQLNTFNISIWLGNRVNMNQFRKRKQIPECRWRERGNHVKNSRHQLH